LNSSSLELKWLHTDFIWCYKLIFSHVNTPFTDFLGLSSTVLTRGHSCKLYKLYDSNNVKIMFFCEPVIGMWNSVPPDVDFKCLSRFTRIMKCINLTKFSKYFYSVTIGQQLVYF
jgi:hypothetical protein